MAEHEIDADKCFKTAVEIVHQAGFIVIEGFNSVKKVETKSGHFDLVTEYDRKVELFIKEKLKHHFPDYKFLGEELSKDTLGNDLTWVLDPIDGTNNFVHGFPQSAISLALTSNREPIIGIVYCPMEEKMYTACKGKGSFFNGIPIKTSSTANVQEALVGLEISLGGKSDKILDALSRRERMCMQHTIGCRSSGCAALGLCYVAHGMWDVYHTEGLAPWDVAAGVLIVREAGGTVTNSYGGRFDILNTEILATGTVQLLVKIVELFKAADETKN